MHDATVVSASWLVRELKDARSKRSSVMKMVQDAATPKPGAGFGGGAKEQRGGRKAEGKREAFDERLQRLLKPVYYPAAEVPAAGIGLTLILTLTRRPRSPRPRGGA